MLKHTFFLICRKVASLSGTDCIVGLVNILYIVDCNVTNYISYDFQNYQELLRTKLYRTNIQSITP